MALTLRTMPPPISRTRSIWCGPCRRLLIRRFETQPHTSVASRLRRGRSGHEWIVFTGCPHGPSVPDLPHVIVPAPTGIVLGSDVDALVLLWVADSPQWVLSTLDLLDVLEQ